LEGTVSFSELTISGTNLLFDISRHSENVEGALDSKFSRTVSFWMFFISSLNDVRPIGRPKITKTNSIIKKKKIRM
jgi:hypothetical protein